MADFKHQVVLIAGASRGIGAAMALQLAAQGARLLLAARDSAALEAVAEQCRAAGAEATAVFPVDLIDEQQCRRLIEYTLEQYGRLDTLVYNAGKGYPGWLSEKPSVQDALRELDLNYKAALFCLHYALPHLIAARGRIVGVASMGALVGIPFHTGYNASKFALRGLLETLRAEIEPAGVSVTLAYPGAVATEQLRQTFGDHLRKIPHSSPEHCAAAILRAAARRRRRVVPTFSGRLMLWVYPFFPRLIEKQMRAMSRWYNISPSSG